MSKKKNKTDEDRETTVIEIVKVSVNSNQKTSKYCEYLERINEQLRQEIKPQVDKLSLYEKLLTEKDQIVHQLTNEKKVSRAIFQKPGLTIGFKIIC
ncbi:unnamed protein product [Acanthoscelides obtectus]|uniref:Uncharacterized protein n=1 Tax=Acanthoscelides obtectus TaxID=200917 RepID=A0A9P0PS46_ACAOB|nr:unnamed protein product [Acanthoscelides obtectus]CAK1679476.1 hypothetical protein AOBTE_LOCUS32275 [Acanthoscelides obtectus]